MFKLVSDYKITKAQKEAAESLGKGIEKGFKDQTLLGVTGCGKTFIAAHLIKKLNLPTLIMSPNKTLAAQLYEEMKSFFPQNAVNYFVSYYDYYQPEAYIPQTDTYIKKDARINKEIDRLRHQGVNDILTRKDTIIVASVSAIYNLGSPQIYQKNKLFLKKNQKMTKRELMFSLVNLLYERNDYEFEEGKFRLRSNFIDIYQASGKEIIRVQISSDKIEKIFRMKAPFGEEVEADSVLIWPAKFWLSEKEKKESSVESIKEELEKQIKKLNKENKAIEAQRLKRRTLYDISLIRETGWCPGIENYSSHLELRDPKRPPYTLIDYFPKNFLLLIDESHISVPQIRGMYAGDQARKKVLVEHGFRLPSCLSNRPLKFEEFNEKIDKTVYISATPAEYEKRKSKQITEDLIRPTGLLDPKIEIRPTKNQINDAIEEIKKTTAKKQRVIITTITKKLSEAISAYLEDKSIKSTYLHSEIKTLERPKILKELREGKYDVLVGINLLREGLDLPEVSLIIIFDADKEGFLRNQTSLMQVMGRAARHIEGRVVMYADTITKSMEASIKEVKRRRKIQQRYNQENNITPSPIKKKIKESLYTEEEPFTGPSKELIDVLKDKLDLAERNLQFEQAAQIKKQIKKLKSES